MMTDEQWVELQSKVNQLYLIPDYPLRPAREAMKTIQPGMGHIQSSTRVGRLVCGCNLIGKKIKAFDGKIMIGDNSLIGPACTIWQQMAIGLGAKWVEAIEKPRESDVFMHCLQRKSTARSADGQIVITDKPEGFGLEMDEKMLRKHCEAYYSIQ